ncbi:MAG: multicopper oxidase domain-containing protein [Thermomicrobiales bacterium]|nr:multicopper oxidase domain-containing protein [Thermomicrobiales bacterium]
MPHPLHGKSGLLPAAGQARHRALLSRRRVLAGVSGLGGAALLGSALRGAARAQDTHEPHTLLPEPGATPSWLSFTPGELVEPEVWRAQAGVLTGELRLDYAFHDVGGYSLHLRGYNGAIPGPTLRVQPGDRLELTLANALPPNPDPTPQNHNLPHHFNTTNLHTHGLHVSPQGESDNVFRAMEPGGAYRVVVDIPADHPGGTFWYHPHHHGAVDAQLTSGCFGALIVTGEFDDVSEIAAAQERLLLLSEVLFDHLGQIEHYDTLWPEAVPRFLAVNGQREPILRMRPGEVQRWRVVQAAHEDNFRLGLAGHQLHVIARDGLSLAAVEPAPDIVLAPGQRVDFLVQAGDPGAYQLAALPNDQGYPSPEGPFATLIVAGDPLPMALPLRLPAPPLATIADAELTGRRTLTFSEWAPESPASAGYQEFAFLVDGRQFDPLRVDQTVALNAVEEWTIINDDVSDHVFHIHTNPFQLTQINGEPLADPVWLDTAVVPREGSITFRTRFLDFTGKLVLHCHMMNHEELGMMQIVEIVAV